MPRSRFLRIVFVAPLAVGLLLALPALASAEDDTAPEPVRVKIRKDVVKKAGPQGSPMEVLHDWFLGQLKTKTPAGKSVQDGLEAWFGGGSDVPMAGLRDAFKARGWDAKAFGTWMSHHMAGASHGGFGPGMVRPFMTHGPAMQGPWMQGPSVRGWFTAPGMQHGMRGHPRPPHAAGCPQCGHGADAHAQPGHPPVHGGRMMGPFGRRGFARGPWGMRGFGGMHGHAFRGPGLGGPMGGMHTQSKAYIMWNDGNGWQRRELAPGTGLGALPFGGPGQGFGQRQGPRGHARHDHGRAGPDHPRPQQPAPGHGGVDIQRLEQILEMLKSMRQGAGEPGEPGGVGGLDLQQLQQLLELLRPKPSPQAQAGSVRVEGVPGTIRDFQEVLKRIEERKKDAAPAPKRVRIKASAPKPVEAIEETEIK